MANENLATYLNDHLSGAVAALDLLEHLESAYEKTDVADFALQLRQEIEADDRVLKDLMARLNIDESSTRKAGGWLAGKLGELKLKFDDPSAGAIRLFQSLEALSLGIEGKRSLWLALAEAAKNSPALQAANYDLLIERAEDQRSRVEERRRETAIQALTAEPSKSAHSGSN